MNYENQMNQLTDKIVLSIEEFKKLAEYQRNLKKLGILDHPFVTKLINRINDVIVSHFKLIVWDFNLLCANETVENFQKAITLEYLVMTVLKQE